MNVSEQLWKRTGEFIEELQSHNNYSIGQPKVELLGDSVLLKLEEYDFTYTDLSDLEQTFKHLHKSDKYDVNTKEGFRFILKEEQK